MSKRQKLIDKLQNGSISADELRNLLRREGFLVRQRGSHQAWIHPDTRIIVISPHGKDLKAYQIKDARKTLLGE